MFKSKKVDLDQSPLMLNYYADGSLIIPKKMESLIKKSLKKRKLKEIELLNYSINNLSIQNTIIDKMISEKKEMLETTKQLFIENLNRNVNPDLLCGICFERRINLILTPCGHTFCDTCFDDQTDECFFCRNPVEARFKIYI